MFLSEPNQVKVWNQGSSTSKDSLEKQQVSDPAHLRFSNCNMDGRKEHLIEDNFSSSEGLNFRLQANELNKQEKGSLQMNEALEVRTEEEPRNLLQLDGEAQQSSDSVNRIDNTRQGKSLLKQNIRP